MLNEQLFYFHTEYLGLTNLQDNHYLAKSCWTEHGYFDGLSTQIWQMMLRQAQHGFFWALQKNLDFPGTPLSCEAVWSCVYPILKTGYWLVNSLTNFKNPVNLPDPCHQCSICLSFAPCFLKKIKILSSIGKKKKKEEVLFLPNSSMGCPWLPCFVFLSCYSLQQFIFFFLSGILKFQAGCPGQ